MEYPWTEKWWWNEIFLVVSTKHIGLFFTPYRNPLTSIWNFLYQSCLGYSHLLSSQTLTSESLVFLKLISQQSGNDLVILDCVQYGRASDLLLLRWTFIDIDLPSLNSVLLLILAHEDLKAALSYVTYGQRTEWVFKRQWHDVAWMRLSFKVGYFLVLFLSGGRSTCLEIKGVKIELTWLASILTKPVANMHV